MARGGMVPMAGGGGGVLPKVVFGLVVVAVLVLVVKHPSDAAGAVKAFASLAMATVDGVATFFRALTQGAATQ